jgi:hypothetical protein
MRSKYWISPVCAGIAIAIILGEYAHILSQPPETFHDQGGLVFFFYYFPIAIAAWLFFGIPALRYGFTGLRAAETSAEQLVSIAGMLGGVIAFGMIFGTLVIA